VREQFKENPFFASRRGGAFLVLIVVFPTTLSERNLVDFPVVISEWLIFISWFGAVASHSTIFAFCYFVWLSQDGSTFAQVASYLHIVFSRFRILVTHFKQEPHAGGD
jgi:hypothetical protein